MKLTTHRPNSLRLDGYDYAQVGLYFVTLVTHGRMPLFGEITNGEMRLNRLGEIVSQEWERIAVVRPAIELGAYVVMPNHLHGILFFQENGAFTVGATRRAFPKRPSHRVAPTGTLRSGSLGAVMGQFKSIVTKRIRAMPGMTDIPVWQRNYYDHIIRNQDDLELTWMYIEANPGQWDKDEENPVK